MFFLQFICLMAYKELQKEHMTQKMLTLRVLLKEVRGWTKLLCFSLLTFAQNKCECNKQPQPYSGYTSVLQVPARNYIMYSSNPSAF